MGRCARQDLEILAFFQNLLPEPSTSIKVIYDAAACWRSALCFYEENMTTNILDLGLRFALVGLANTALGLSIIYACKFLLGFGDVLSNALGYCFGLCLSFALNRKWTFRHKGAMWPALRRFLAVFAVAYICNLTIVLVLIRHLEVNDYLAHAIAVVPYTVIFFFGSRMFAFASGSTEEAPMRAHGDSIKASNGSARHL